LNFIGTEVNNAVTSGVTTGLTREDRMMHRDFVSIVPLRRQKDAGTIEFYDGVASLKHCLSLQKFLGV